MSAIEKDKNRFIITLENGGQTYFDFTDGKIYGVSGKPIKNFSKEAKNILKKNTNDDFIARWLIERNNPSYLTYESIPKWDIGMVETIYSLYNKKYPMAILLAVAYYCDRTEYKLNSQGIKLLTEALKTINYRGYIIGWDEIDAAILNVKYSYLPLTAREIITHCYDKESQNIMVKDIEKIMFHMEHEEWQYLNNNNNFNEIARNLSRYIKLCALLHKERTYKNLFLSICLMEKEKDLIANKLLCDWQFKDKLFYENDDFTIIVPTTAVEFQQEADNQHNCVFHLYYPKVLNRETHIVFVRKKISLDNSYITCEISNTGKIIQYLARYNAFVDEKEALLFKAEYEKFLAKAFKD